MPAAIFPADAHYVALGHLHRRQTLPRPCPVHYSGAPLAVDFGEQENTPVVCLVRGRAQHARRGHRHPDHGRPAAAHRARHRRRTGRAAATRSATTSSASGCASPPGPGCAEEVTTLLPNALEVRIDPEFAAPVAAARPSPAARRDRTPVELFGEYLRHAAASPTRGWQELFAHVCTSGCRSAD